ncbi:hypothetical protein EV702DRAFT_657085 [Suillus placidus]|uniref:Uncharacterized protein n=1 Tax=Suillus placidus TaxID=48579 RepID=A0A9P6ZLI8_9AGAM|nr:hypothetical protein EV702DRAFT_657085 [Suillus placidus]
MGSPSKFLVSSVGVPHMHGPASFVALGSPGVSAQFCCYLRCRSMLCSYDCISNCSGEVLGFLHYRVFDLHVHGGKYAQPRLPVCISSALLSTSNQTNVLHGYQYAPIIILGHEWSTQRRPLTYNKHRHQVQRERHCDPSNFLYHKHKVRIQVLN